MKQQDLSDEIRLIWEEELPPAEFQRRLSLALGDAEDMERQAELCAWFSRRYRTVGERLTYARRKYEEWTRPLPISRLRTK